MGKEIRKVAFFCVSLALCIAVLTVYSQSVQEKNERTPEEPEATEAAEAAEGLTADLSVITSIAVQAVPMDWDGDAEKDGLMLYITFYDAQGKRIEFEDTEYSIRIRIYKAEPGSDGTMVKGALLYDFCCPPIKKMSSHEVSARRGIKISLTLSDHAGEWGIIGAEVDIPGVGIFYAEGEPVPLSP